MGTPNRQVTMAIKLAVVLVTVAIWGMVAFGLYVTYVEGAPECREQAAIVVVDINDARYPHIIDHIHDAVRNGEPEYLTLARDQATANRRASLAASNLPPRPSEDRDEWPMAFSDEGGRTADVRYVDDAENQGSGSVIGHVLRDFCDGQRFTVR